MKKPPFELPLNYQKFAGTFDVRDADRDIICVVNIPSRQQLDYIIRAVNSFEKMREALIPFANNSVRLVEGVDLIVSPAFMDDLRRAAVVLKEIEDA